MNNTSAKKVLIVEDEKELLDLYVQLLESEGYDVDKASDGEMALKKITDKPFDLILLDIILPKMDGLQVLDNLRKASNLPKGNVVLLTNLGQDLVVAKALEFNVRGYIVKSDYTPEELLKEVKGYLGNGEVSSSLVG
ncbi:hypothetical protein BH09PAT2_BH09PAT2_10100 [soil metagenome]